MGWWYTDNGDDIIGDGPADTITDALIAISSHCRDNDREMVTLQELLNAVAKAIAHESETFLSDADHGAIRVTATFDGRSPCVSVDTAVDSDVLHELLHRFSEVAAEYLDTELERKPRLNELLAVFNFVLRADPAAYLSDGAGIQLESITGEWIKGETIDPGALLSEFKSACRAVARSTAAEQRQRLRRRIELGVGLDDIEAALRADDWEIRASAMLAVARDNLAEVGKTIRGLRFPATRSEGLDRN